MDTKNHKVFKVKPGSIANEMGIEPGDIVETVCGSAVVDVLDYIEKTSREEFEMEIMKINGERWVIEVEKESYEELGIVFNDRIMDIEKSCQNKCVFCFVDQLPPGMRPTLYFKDDDWRLSFLMGNYVTLTNLTRDDIDRIIRERISPLYVSVHSTNPSLRSRMMKNEQAFEIMEILNSFKTAGIAVHCQVVICPGLNDGNEFERTIGELLDLWPAVQSVAVVPVGLTSHRQNLVSIKPFDAITASDLIAQVEKWQKYCRIKHDTAFIFAADELYLMAKLPLPDFEEYEDFPQLENGVGLLSKLINEFEEEINDINFERSHCGLISIVTGMSAYPVIRSLAERITDRFGVKIIVFPVKNHYFGELVTVAGLITGQDIISGLRGRELGSKLLIPASMLRAEGDLFLDDLRLEDIEKALSLPVVPVPVNGRELLNAILEYKE